MMQIIFGLLAIGWSMGSLYFFLKGYGQNLNKMKMRLLVNPEEATKSERYFLLSQSFILLILGIWILFFVER